MKICKDKTGADKKLHVFVAFVIAAFVGGIVANIPPHNPWLTTAIAFAVAIAVGIWKEVKDSRQKGNHFCVWDLLWDTAGALAGSPIGGLAAHFINVFI